MTLQEKLKWFGTGLAAVCGQTYHYTKAPKAQAPYCVWAEDSEIESFQADNRKAEQMISGSISYFTKKEYDHVCDDIQTYLYGAAHYWYLSAVLYEPETGLIHYEWRFEIDGKADRARNG